MRLQLKPFQENAVADLRNKARRAAEAAAQAPQALLLSAPTGAGKTVMAAALLEALLFGGADSDPDPEATFLWITDQPELNEQTKEKFLAASDGFGADRIETVEAARFDQRVFDAGKLYFLNTQKLGQNSSLVKKGDRRRYSLWETIANTAQERAGSFWVVLDEAHRGMAGNGRDEAETIVQRLILGWQDGGVPPVPLIFGISATPKRFNDLLDRAGNRDRLIVSVDPQEVRASGLLKDVITVYHTDEEQPSDLSLLAAAAKQLRNYELEWAAHHARNKGTDLVRPVLVVQVEDGTGKGKQALSRTDLAAAVRTLKEELKDLKDEEIAHAFQEGTTEIFGEHKVRYLAPSAIESDPKVRVVFFKRSLSTGWDCPRAEVMMSFRRARDETLIAQLVGRMVRTPLAYSVRDPEVLASVCLYLPQYDRETVSSVIARLQEPSPDDGIPGTESRTGNELVGLRRNEELSEVFAAVSELPHVIVERVPKLAPVRRLLRLGDRLRWDGIDESARERYEQALLEAIAKERRRLAKRPDYKQRLADAALIDIRGHKVAVAGEGKVGEETAKVKAHSLNVKQAFDQAGRRLAAGFQSTYLKHRSREKGAPGLDEIRRELWVIVSDEKAREAIESKATELCESELAKFETRINKEVPEKQLVEYRAIRRQGAKPHPDRWTLPRSILGTKRGQRFDKHLYVNGGGAFRAELNTLERDVLAEEQARDDFVAFLRNADRKPWSFSIDYEAGGESKAMYPDFLVFRRQDGHIVVDIIEPHSLSHADSVGKVKGLAAFAEDCGSAFGRIEFADRVDGQIKRLNFQDPETRKRAKILEGSDQLRQLLLDS